MLDVPTGHVDRLERLKAEDRLAHGLAKSGPNIYVRTLQDNLAGSQQKAVVDPARHAIVHCFGRASQVITLLFRK